MVKTVFDDDKIILSSVGLGLFNIVQGAGPVKSWMSSIGSSLVFFDERTYLAGNVDQIELPAVEEIVSFVTRAQEAAKFSSEVVVTAFSLFSRLVKTEQGKKVGPCTWKLAFFMCLLLAQKLCDDIPFDNASFATLWRASTRVSSSENPAKRLRTFKIKVTDVNKMESVLLNIFEFRVHVTQHTFTEVFFNLRTDLLKSEYLKRGDDALLVI